MIEPLPIVIRLAERGDIAALIALYVDDAMGGHGDTADEAAMPNYLAAFDAISASPNEMIFVVEMGESIVGTFQLAILSKLTGQGSRTLMVQSVQTQRDVRGQGIGAKMMQFAINFAKEHDMNAVQLMSNASRQDAHRFYQRLGFESTHIGFRMVLK